ncbi:hypothetical protein ABT160_02470 [Streptomyces sp. NPDC001941]|uniref:hypothetical protein n=1 Tax=Streptomyces sp. NPDC001941 TaxID=3154659 RepID=UPI0033220834
MSEPTTSDPATVVTRDGTRWVQKGVNRDARGLYVVEGSACGCPTSLMTTLPELAEMGLRPAVPVRRSVDKLRGLLARQRRAVCAGCTAPVAEGETYCSTVCRNRDDRHDSLDYRAEDGR